MQKPIVLRARVLPREPQASDVAPQILVLLQRHARRPVAVAPVRPLVRAPARVHERGRLGDVAEHLAQHRQDLLLGGVVVLGLDDRGLPRHDGHEEDVAAGQEVRVRQGLEERVVPARGGRRVEEVLGVGGPELGGKLEEDLGVDAHVEAGNRRPFPGGQRRREGHGCVFGLRVLQDAEGEGADGVLRFEARVVCGVGGDGVVGVADVGDDGVQMEVGVVGGEEGGCLADDEGVEAALVEDVVVLFGELVECCVLRTRVNALLLPATHGSRMLNGSKLTYPATPKSSLDSSGLYPSSQSQSQNSMACAWKSRPGVHPDVRNPARPLRSNALLVRISPASCSKVL